MNKCLILITAIAFTSCVSQQKVSDLTIDQQAAYQRIVSNNIEGKDVEIIGIVTGNFCFRDANKVTKENKRQIKKMILKTGQDDLRINAAKLNADAITNESCKQEGIDWAKNCWASASCTGNAVKFK